MAKLIQRYLGAKMLTRLMRKNPYAFGLSAAALAATGVALSLSRNRRVRALTESAARRLSPHTEENARSATPQAPY